MVSLGKQPHKFDEEDEDEEDGEEQIGETLQSKIFNLFQVDWMVLSDLEDAILESDSNLTYGDISNMPFYTFMIKLERAKERAEERENKRQKEEGGTSSYKTPSYKDVHRDAMKGMPSGFKAPKINLPSGLR